MVVFDLRVEAQQLSLVYVVAPVTVLLVLASLAPMSIRSRQSLVIPEDVRTLALIFAVALIIIVWHEYYERKRAESLVEQCMSGGCDVVEGRISEVRYDSGVNDRYAHRVPRGSFKVGDKYFAHYSQDFKASHFPSNVLNDGDRVRVYTKSEVLVLVEKLE